jgi:hypothetical protein
MFDTGHWHWPQWTMFIVSVLNLIFAAMLHGKPRSEYSFPLALVGFAIGMFVMISGGFFA